MNDKLEHLKMIEDNGIIAVIRANNSDEALKIVDAVMKGGIHIIEITMTVPDAVEVIKEVRRSFFASELLLGAGTVLDAETARLCIVAGAEYLVSPHLDKTIIEMANKYRKLVVPGVMTPKEVVNALELGADILKIFPAELFGPKIIKAIKGPFPQAKLVPTGGVNLKNLDEWFKAGSIAVGVGGGLTGALNEGGYDLLTTRTKEFVERIKESKALLE